LLHFETRAAQSRVVSKIEAKFCIPLVKLGKGQRRCLRKKLRPNIIYTFDGGLSAATESQVPVKKKWSSTVQPSGIPSSSDLTDIMKTWKDNTLNDKFKVWTTV